MSLNIQNNRVNFESYILAKILIKFINKLNYFFQSQIRSDTNPFEKQYFRKIKVNISVFNFY